MVRSVVTRSGIPQKVKQLISILYMRGAQLFFFLPNASIRLNMLIIDSLNTTSLWCKLQVFRYPKNAFGRLFSSPSNRYSKCSQIQLSTANNAAIYLTYLYFFIPFIKCFVHIANDCDSQNWVASSLDKTFKNLLKNTSFCDSLSHNSDLSAGYIN